MLTMCKLPTLLRTISCLVWRRDTCCADHILGLALSVFRTDAVLLHLRDKDEVLAKFSNAAAFEPGTCAAVCRLLEPPPAEVFIVEDPSSDPR